MDHQMYTEPNEFSLGAQVVLIPASVLRVYRDIAMDAALDDITGEPGAWWGITESSTMIGPYFRPEDAERQSNVTDFSGGDWTRLVYAARNIPLWVLDAVEEAIMQGERYVTLPLPLVMELLAPLHDVRWRRWEIGSMYAPRLVAASLALINASIEQQDPLIVEVSE